MSEINILIMELLFLFIQLTAFLAAGSFLNANLVCFMLSLLFSNFSDLSAFSFFTLGAFTFFSAATGLIPLGSSCNIFVH